MSKHKNEIKTKEGKHQKMSPYSKGQKRKWSINNTGEVSISPQKKEEVKNANRSLKKGVRQQLKKDLKKQIDDFLKD